jgi:hypothetical protein
VKYVVLFLSLALTVASASGLRVAGSDARVGGPISDSRLQIADCRFADGVLDDTIVIAYDDGTHKTWWCSDKDSFGAAVKFTPAEYPCQIVGARAEVGYDLGQQVYLRVFDDDGAGGLPGTVLYEQQRLDIPHSPSPGFKDYDLTAPVTIDSGDFYICFWQKHWFHLLFGSDMQFNYVARQWWYLPPTGWMTPVGMDAADHLIRARVLYGTGIDEELTGDERRTASVPTIVRGVLNLGVDSRQHSACRAELLDATGRKVIELRVGSNDVSRLSPGIYFVRLSSEDAGSTQKLVVQR